MNFLLFPPLIGYRKIFPKFTCPEWIDFSGPKAGSVKVFRAKIAKRGLLEGFLELAINFMEASKKFKI